MDVAEAEFELDIGGMSDEFSHRWPLVQCETIFVKQSLVYRCICHLKRDVSSVPDNLGINLDQVHKQAAK